MCKVPIVNVQTPTTGCNGHTAPSEQGLSRQLQPKLCRHYDLCSGRKVSHSYSVCGVLAKLSHDNRAKHPNPHALFFYYRYVIIYTDPFLLFHSGTLVLLFRLFFFLKLQASRKLPHVGNAHLDLDTLCCTKKNEKILQLAHSSVERNL